MTPVPLVVLMLAAGAVGVLAWRRHAAEQARWRSLAQRLELTPGGGPGELRGQWGGAPFLLRRRGREVEVVRSLAAPLGVAGLHLTRRVRGQSRLPPKGTRWVRTGDLHTDEWLAAAATATENARQLVRALARSEPVLTFFKRNGAALLRDAEVSCRLELEQVSHSSVRACVEELDAVAQALASAWHGPRAALPAAAAQGQVRQGLVRLLSQGPSLSYLRESGLGLLTLNAVVPLTALLHLSGSRSVFEGGTALFFFSVSVLCIFRYQAYGLLLWVMLYLASLVGAPALVRLAWLSSAPQALETSVRGLDQHPGARLFSLKDVRASTLHMGRFVERSSRKSGGYNTTVYCVMPLVATDWTPAEPVTAWVDCHVPSAYEFQDRKGLLAGALMEEWRAEPYRRAMVDAMKQHGLKVAAGAVLLERIHSPEELLSSLRSRVLWGLLVPNLVWLAVVLLLVRRTREELLSG